MESAVPVYGDGQNVRDWIHVEDHCEAVAQVLERGVLGQVFNVGGHGERTNLEVARRILTLLGKDESLISFVADRPRHDRRYAIDTAKIERELGWKPRHTVEDGLSETVEWYRDHAEWWGSLA